MNHPKTLLILSAALGATSAAAQNNGLLYTTAAPERSNQCGSTPALNRVMPNSIQYVEPVAGAPAVYPYRSKAFLPMLGSNMVGGDDDCDTQITNPNMFGAQIDAVLHPRNSFGVVIPADKSQCYFSPAGPFTDISGNTLTPGDVGRLLPTLGGAGLVDHFVHEADLRAAFGVPAASIFNVDAVCMARSLMSTGGMDLYISLEDTTPIDVPAYGPTLVEDGAILYIPAPAIAWATGPDGEEFIPLGAIAPASGWIAARESFVDMWVNNSQISDRTGAPVTQIGDLDGLTPDPMGPGWQSPWAPFRFPHLLFCGDDPSITTPGVGLSGGGIVSTVANGSIGVVNARPMGEVFPLPTSGGQDGLVTSNVRALNGLSITNAFRSHFSMDTEQGRLLAPGIINIEIGGGDAGGPPAIVLWDLATNAPCGFDPGVFSLPNLDFSMLYPTSVFGSTLINPAGCSTVSLPIPAAVYFFLAGQALEWQAAQVMTSTTGATHLTNPVRVEFY